MRYSFTLNTQAFSVNAYRFRKNFVKTPDARDYETKILAMLEDHKTLHDISDAFKEQGGEFHVYITCTYPHHIFYNQSKQISAKTFDCSNVEKPILDLLINEFMGLDDRFVTKLVSEKKVGAGYTVEITLEHYSSTHA